MLSWSVAVASRSRENRGKQPRFCQRNTKRLFANTRATLSGRNFFIFKMAVWGGSHAHEMPLLIWNTVLPAVIVQEQRSPSHGSQRKNAEARFGVPLVWGYRSPERASALSYFQSLSKSSMALSRAVFMPFSMMLIISFSRMDYCFFLFFFFLSFSRSEV